VISVGCDSIGLRVMTEITVTWTEITRPQYRRAGLRYASDLTDAEWADDRALHARAAPLRATPLYQIAGGRRGHVLTLLHGSAGGRCECHLVRGQERRTYSGRPSSSMRFNTRTARAASFTRRRSVRERNASPITRLKRPMSASTKARQL
jgi:hypothetical protein